MKMILFGAMAALILGAGIMAGCIDQVADPDLDFHILEVTTNSTSPNPESVEADGGYHFVYVKVRVENENKDADLTIGPRTFTLDDNSTTEVKGKYLANNDLRRIDSIRVDAFDEKIFWVVFSIPEDTRMLYMRYRGTLDEPVEKKMPDY
jgi:hypothetical protein